MEIENKEYLLYSLETAFDEFEKEDRIPSDPQKGFYRMGTLLMWTLCCLDRITKASGISIGDEEKEKILGLKFINNCLKHNSTLIELKSVEHGRSLPFYVGSSLKEYRWADLDYVHIPSSHKFVNQEKTFYDKWYKNKSVRISFQYRIDEIKDYFAKDQ